MTGDVRRREHVYGRGRLVVYEGNPNTSTAFVAGKPVPNEP